MQPDTHTHTSLSLPFPAGRLPWELSSPLPSAGRTATESSGNSSSSLAPPPIYPFAPPPIHRMGSSSSRPAAPSSGSGSHGMTIGRMAAEPPGGGGGGSSGMTFGRVAPGADISSWAGSSEPRSLTNPARSLLAEEPVSSTRARSNLDPR